MGETATGSARGSSVRAATAALCTRQPPGKGDSGGHERTAKAKSRYASAGRPAGSGSAPPGPACCVPNGAADKRVFSAFRKQRNGPISLFLKETAICTGASKFYMNLRTFSGKSQKAEVPAEYACCWAVVVMMACLVVVVASTACTLCSRPRPAFCRRPRLVL